MKVLILGVGNAQVDAIKYLKSAGHKVVGISYREEGAGVSLVDEFALIDIVDKEAVLNFAKGKQFDLVYSVGSDVAMPTVSFVSDALGLPCFFKEDTADLLQDKHRFRVFLAEQDLNPIPARCLNSLADARGWDIFPAIIKPVDSQGQRGVYEVYSHDDINRHYGDAIAASRRGELILEAFIDGPELSVNTFFKDGDLYFFCISSRLVVEGFPGGIVSGHNTPVALPGALEREVKGLIRKLAVELDIENGPIYLQIKYQGTKPFIIEAAPRLDGCHLWKLIKKSTDIDLLELVFGFLLDGEVPDISTHIRRDGWKLTFFLSPPGEQFVSNNCLEREESAEVVYYYKNGDTVQSINGHQEKTGYQLFRFQDRNI